VKKLLLLLILIISFSCSDSEKEIIYPGPLEIGGIYQGGIIFELSGQHGYVAKMQDSGVMNWWAAMDLESNDWYVPNINQLEKMYINIGQGADNIGDFANSSYWSSDYYGPSSSFTASMFNFANGTWSPGKNPVLNFRVRLVHSF